MFWPFNRKKPKPDVEYELCFPIGEYILGDSIEHLREVLIPLSKEELLALNSGFQFVGEEIMHAPSTRHLGLEWDIILGTVNGYIYKIAAQWSGPRAQAGKTYRELVIYCTKNYGNKRNEPLWEASDGNVVLLNVNYGNEATIDVFCTSRDVRGFEQTAHFVPNADSK